MQKTSYSLGSVEMVSATEKEERTSQEEKSKISSNAMQKTRKSSDKRDETFGRRRAGSSVKAAKVGGVRVINEDTGSFSATST